MSEQKNTNDEIKKLDQQIKNIVNSWNQDPQKIIEYLEFANRFSYQYSYKNSLLIQLQNPGAIFCQSYLQWEKQGYHVKKGAHGMQVYVPVSILILDTDDGKIPYNKASEEQKEKYQEGKISGDKILHFKIGYTFDIAQTDYPPDLYPSLMDTGIPSEYHKKCFFFFDNKFRNLTRS